MYQATFKYLVQTRRNDPPDYNKFLDQGYGGPTFKWFIMNQFY